MKRGGFFVSLAAAIAAPLARPVAAPVGMAMGRLATTVDDGRMLQAVEGPIYRLYVTKADFEAFAESLPWRP